MATPFHAQYLALVAEIEARFAVSRWTSGDAHLWPLARMDLYLDLYRQHVADPEAGRPSRVVRGLRTLAHPLATLGRRDNVILRPHRADILFLGDGVSVECIDGAWEDRYGEPLMAELEGDGARYLHLQPGRRTPWRRPTLAVDLITSAAQALAPLVRAPLDLPDHAEVVDFLARQGVPAPSLRPERLARRAMGLRARAQALGLVLDIARPRLAFTTTWYAGLGSALALACRRRGILSVDVQHCPQGGRHKAYGWAGVGTEGYTTLPALFWTWDPADAAHISAWADGHWHQALAGGHPRLGPFLDDADPRTRAWDERFRQAAGGDAQRDILVALQTTGPSAVWDAVADRIAAGPPEWRWWIRRHPAAGPGDDRRHARLLALRGPNIRIDPASALPLPALLRHMDTVVSLASGVAAEAVLFGVPALFLSADATGPFGHLAEAGHARVVADLDALIPTLAALPKAPSRRAAQIPNLAAGLRRLEAIAASYRALWADA
ncbi:hypothetical protein [Nitrospirillum bahiense]|uniref:Uncharacterized protein n=1 Tax=Nitrospirillum amazonense TaxID=28077 RepID=A0A560F191_9PROT|nr:hypothetical protein [Nitrospirillum amazonense]TWB15374.1 hypothetical protein FBZ88_13025 [Nitrospirillum amazonense]